MALARSPGPAPRRSAPRLAWWALVCGLGLASVAHASSLELLLPVARLSADGEQVALVQRGEGGRLEPLWPGTTLVARGARVREAPAQAGAAVWWVEPEPGEDEVELVAQGPAGRRVQRLPVGPPATRLVLELSPSAPVKGRDKEATLTVRLHRPDGSPAVASTAPVVRANVGRVEGLREVSPGVFQGRYVLPSSRFPEVAVLVALSAWPHPDAVHGAVGALRVPLASAIELPGHSEPGARMSLRIGGVTYGPVQVGEDGRFRIPVVVPPGVSHAEGTAEDRAGNRRALRVDLMVPPSDALACIANPPQLPADGTSRARLLCAVSDARGRPLPPSGVRLQAEAGRLQGPRAAEDGLLEWRYTAPPAGSGAVGVVATVARAGVRGREALSLTLLPAPASQLTLTLAEPLVHLGSRTWASVAVRDARGQPRQETRVRLEASVGTLGPVALEPDGRARVPWHLPEESVQQRAEVVAHAFAPAGETPARLEAWSEAGRLVVAAVDLAARPVPGLPLRVAGVERVTDEEGRVSLPLPAPGPLQVGVRDWPELQRTFHVLDAEGRLFPTSPPTGLTASASVLLAPPLPVNVRLRVEGRTVTYWVEHPDGRVLEGRDVRVSLSQGVLPPVRRGGDGRSRFQLAAAQPVVVSVADVASGVTAVAQVQP